MNKSALAIIPKDKCVSNTIILNEAMITDKARTWCALIGKPARVFDPVLRVSNKYMINNFKGLHLTEPLD
jgi:hypothetical protein